MWLLLYKYILERNERKSPTDILSPFTQKPRDKNEKYVLYKWCNVKI